MGKNLQVSIRYIEVNYVDNKMLQKDAVKVIQNSSYGNLGLSMNHQPYIEYLKYQWDDNMGCLNILFDIKKKGIIAKIIDCNEKVAFLVNKCYQCYYETVLIKGKICIIESDNKDIEKVVLIPEFIEGYQHNY